MGCPQSRDSGNESRIEIIRKVLLLGPSQSGKTQLFNRFMNREFNEQHVETTSVVTETIISQQQKFMIFDLGGGTTKTFWKFYFENAIGIIYVIDVSDDLRKAKQYLKEIYEYFSNSPLQIMIVLNKIDKIDTEKIHTIQTQIMQDVDQFNIDVVVVKCSAKTQQGVQIAFSKFINILVKVQVDFNNTFSQEKILDFT